MKKPDPVISEISTSDAIYEPLTLPGFHDEPKQISIEVQRKQLDLGL